MKIACRVIVRGVVQGVASGRSSMRPPPNWDCRVRWEILLSVS